MKRILNVLWLALLVGAMFSCSSAEETKSLSDQVEGDKLNLSTRVYADGKTTFDFTGFGISDSSIVNVAALYKDATDNQVLSAYVYVDDDGVEPASWNVEDMDNEIDKEVTSSIFTQSFSDAEYPAVIFNVNDTAVKTTIYVTDMTNSKEYMYEGNNNGNGEFTLISVEIDD